jgi:glutamine---fructose-6-phosphate transaminase (isomerizing)
VDGAHLDRLRALRAEPSRDAAGDQARLRRVGLTRAEMTGQGAAIAATVAAEAQALDAIAARLRDREIGSVVVAGCGDSWFVGMGVRHALERLLGVPVLPAQALDFALYDHAGVGVGTLAIGLSAGGDTPAVMAALRAARARGAFALGVSNAESTPIQTEFDAGLRVRATRKGWPTQSSAAAMALLIGLGLRLARAPHPALAAEFAKIGDVADATLATSDESMAAIADDLARAGTLFFAGAGPHCATAQFAAAKIRELAPIHAAAFALEELHHYRLPKSGDPIFVVAPDESSRPRAFDTVLVGKSIGARVYVALTKPDREIEALATGVIRLPECDPALAPIAHAPAFHALAYHFARARDAIGLGYGGVWDRDAT